MKEIYSTGRMVYKAKHKKCIPTDSNIQNDQIKQ